MYAVVTTGGKQYRVEAGSELIIERLAEEPGASITFDRVLLVGDGDAVTIGSPTVDGASVSGTVLAEELGPKLIIFKFKQKVKYRRTRGHRQHLTRVRIDEISTGTKKSRRADAATDADAEVSAKSEAASEETAKPVRARRATKPKAEAATQPGAEADAPAKPATRRRSPAKKAADKATAEE